MQEIKSVKDLGLCGGACGTTQNYLFYKYSGLISAVPHGSITSVLISSIKVSMRRPEIEEMTSKSKAGKMGVFHR